MRQVVKGVEDMIDGATAEQVLDELGVFAVGLLQDEIKNGDYVANAPATIAQKGSNQPLIDTGLLRQSATSRKRRIPMQLRRKRQRMKSQRHRKRPERPLLSAVCRVVYM